MISCPAKMDFFRVLAHCAYKLDKDMWKLSSKSILLHAYLVMYATLSHLGHKCGMVFAFLQGLFLVKTYTTDLIVYVQRKSRKKIDQVCTWQAKYIYMTYSRLLFEKINDA